MVDLFAPSVANDERLGARGRGMSAAPRRQAARGRSSASSTAATSAMCCRRSVYRPSSSIAAKRSGSASSMGATWPSTSPTPDTSKCRAPTISSGPATRMRWSPRFRRSSPVSGRRQSLGACSRPSCSPISSGRRSGQPRWATSAGRLSWPTTIASFADSSSGSAAARSRSSAMGFWRRSTDRPGPFAARSRSATRGDRVVAAIRGARGGPPSAPCSGRRR